MQITLSQILVVGVGGFLGSALRFVSSNYVQFYCQDSRFPLGTLFVNLLGCFLIGFLSARFQAGDVLNKNLSLLVLVGFLGGFTTFSTFGADTLALLKNGDAAYAFLNAIGQVVLGVGLVFIGFRVAS